MNRVVSKIVAPSVVFAVLAGSGVAGVNVDVHVGVPVAPVAPAPLPPPRGIVVAEPPALILVPNTSVYFVPDVGIDLFFSSGYWWTRRDGRWLRARHYGGPWVGVRRSYVPGPILGLPHDYRHAYGRGERVPYGQWRKTHRMDDEHRRGRWRERHGGD